MSDDDWGEADLGPDEVSGGPSGPCAWVARDVRWVSRELAPATEAPAGTTDFVASTGKPDRMRDILDQGSWLLDSFLKNPVILADHGIPVVGEGRAKVA